MPLYRFGRAAVRLRRAVSIKEMYDETGQPTGVMRVHYEGAVSVDYEREDADALRAYVASLEPPPAHHRAEEARLPPPGPLEHSARDPKTGKPLQSDSGAGLDVPRA